MTTLPLRASSGSDPLSSKTGWAFVFGFIARFAGAYLHANWLDGKL